MRFKLIPAGTFVMGSPAGEPARDMDENQHRVTLSRSFYMQTTEVTQSQWQTVTGTNPASFSNCGGDCPVERVSWEHVQEYIEKLNQRTGQKYRLPTEAEFEYAARAGTTTALPSGEIKETACGPEPALEAMGWYCYNSKETTHPGGRKQPNAWGLYDMHGNVWEWCADSWDGSQYPLGPTTDPISPTPGSQRVIRGGSWYDDVLVARSANRDYCKPHYRNDFVGFRLVLDLEEERGKK